jgi:hypothetical protein
MLFDQILKLGKHILSWKFKSCFKNGEWTLNRIPFCQNTLLEAFCSNHQNFKYFGYYVPMSSFQAIFDEVSCNL